MFQGLLDTKHVGAVYNVLGSLGEGAFGIVRIVQKNNYEQLKFTMKMVPLEEGEEHLVQSELDILCKMDHPIAISLFEVYFDKRSLHLVGPLYEGGDLD